MATGINVERLNKIKIELLNYVEDLNKITEKMEEKTDSISKILSGEVKTNVFSKISSIKEQLPNVKKNVSEYINVLDKVENVYKIQDVELGDTISNDIVNIGR